MANTITATAWVPRGYAAAFPTKYVFDDDEYARIAKLAKIEYEDAKQGLEEAQAEAGTADSNGQEDGGVALLSEKVDKIHVQSNGDLDDDLKEYDLEHYDDEPNEDETGAPMGMFGNVKDLAYHQSNDDDPYITLKEDEEEDEEREELQVLPTDNLLLAARIEDDVAHLEVYVYEDDADNLYVHHDIMLPAIPLAVEWFDVPVGKTGVDTNSKGNFVAVGTMDPDIELWDLDTIDCMYPNAILGHGTVEQEAGPRPAGKKKKKRSKKANDDYHVDAVLSLSANRQHRNLLASSSADQTIKLWDLNTTKCAKSYAYHTDKVCSTSWHPSQSTVLLSGAYDRTVVAADMRAPNATAPRWGVESDVEAVRWDPHDPNFFYVTTEKGLVHYHDARNAPKELSLTKPVWSLQAHDEAVNSFDINPAIPGFLVTGSNDKTVKLWNIQSSGPSMVVSRNLDVGRVFSTCFAPDKAVAFRLAVAGSKGNVQIWDTSTNGAIRRAFAERGLEPADGDVKERLVGVTEAEEDSEDEEGLPEAEEGYEEKDGWESMSE